MSAKQSDPIMTEPDRVRIVRAMNKMPYGALLRANANAETMNCETIIAYLERLAEVLRTYAEKDGKETQELHQLRSDVQAMRRLLGTDTVSQ